MSGPWCVVLNDDEAQELAAIEARLRCSDPDLVAAFDRRRPLVLGRRRRRAILAAMWASAVLMVGGAVESAPVFVLIGCGLLGLIPLVFAIAEMLCPGMAHRRSPQARDGEGER